jgi:hypothetical protein
VAALVLDLRVVAHHVRRMMDGEFGQRRQRRWMWIKDKNDWQ